MKYILYVHLNINLINVKFKKLYSHLPAQI